MLPAAAVNNIGSTEGNTANDELLDFESNDEETVNIITSMEKNE